MSTPAMYERKLAEIAALEARLADWHKIADERSAEIVRLSALLSQANELLREARHDWVKVGYGASHEDVAECRDFCRRVDDFFTADRELGKPSANRCPHKFNEWAQCGSPEGHDGVHWIKTNV